MELAVHLLIGIFGNPAIPSPTSSPVMSSFVYVARPFLVGVGKISKSRIHTVQKSLGCARVKSGYILSLQLTKILPTKSDWNQTSLFELAGVMYVCYRFGAMDG